MTKSILLKICFVQHAAWCDKNKKTFVPKISTMELEEGKLGQPGKLYLKYMPYSIYW